MYDYVSQDVQLGAVEAILTDRDDTRNGRAGSEPYRTVTIHDQWPAPGRSTELWHQSDLLQESQRVPLDPFFRDLVTDESALHEACGWRIRRNPRHRSIFGSREPGVPAKLSRWHE
jgi:hypothetical protein